MSDRISKDDAVLVAHKVVLAHLVAEAEVRLGDDAPMFLDEIRRAAVASIERAQGDANDMELRLTKRLIIEAIADLFGGD